MKLRVNRAAAKLRPPNGHERSCVRSQPPDDIPGKSSWKRVLDIGCLILASPILLPLMSLISLGIKLVSPGPVFFKQERIGYRGRSFKLFKFRSMTVGVNSQIHEKYMGHLIKTDAPMKKLDEANDPTLITWGLFLRASGLDELPQVINVLKGEMSLVGPRPCTTYEYSRYSPWHKERLQALPGITGLWQVSGKNKTTFTEMMQLDIAYTQRKSLWLDLKILGKTVWVPISQLKEAYSTHASAERRVEVAGYSQPAETKH
jgi:exopolysaccharide production protein ExoY